MSLSDDKRSPLITYCLEKAQNTMKHVKGNAAMDFWPVVANRLYYAAYYAVTALLLGKGLTVQTHHGVIHLFNLHFIKTGIMDSSYGKLYGRLFSLRQTGDYDDLFNISKEDVLPLIEPTERMINDIMNSINK